MNKSLDDNNMNNTWDCYLCGFEADFENEPSGWLANYHPLCISCTNKIYKNTEHEDRFRLTYHIKYGDLYFFEKNFILIKSQKLN